VVSNTLNRKTIGKDSLGIGLENLRRRYQLLAGKKLEVKTTSTRFEVVLPKITQAEIRGDRIQGTN
jgi:signal transduction histidine kinase